MLFCLFPVSGSASDILCQSHLEPPSAYRDEERGRTRVWIQRARGFPCYHSNGGPRQFGTGNVERAA